MKYSLILVCLFSFLPFVNATTDYSDYEIVEVEELPTASADTLNKLFKVNGNYYATEIEDVIYTPLSLNENLKGKTIYFNFNDEFFNDTKSQFDGYYLLYDINNQSYTFHLFFSDDYLNGRINGFTFIQQGSSQYINKSSYTFPIDKDYIITKLYDNEFTKSNYFSNISLTPFEINYYWNEILVVNNDYTTHDLTLLLVYLLTTIFLTYINFKIFNV